MTSSYSQGLLSGLALSFASLWMIHVHKRKRLSVAFLSKTGVSRDQIGKSLPDTTQLLTTLINSAPVSIVIMDLNEKIQIWNKTSEKIFGWSESEVVGKSLPFVPKEKHIESKTMFKKLFERESLIAVKVNRQKKDGTPILISVSAAPLINKQNEVAGIVAVLSDITVQEDSENHLKKALDRAKKADQAKSEFLANMSHEIRTPLNGIIGMANLLSDGSLTELQQKYAQIIQESGKNLVNIINDILDFSKIEAGKLSLETTDLQIISLLERQISLVANQAKEKGIQIEFTVSSNMEDHLQGDPLRIGQIFLNLLNNAIKFTHKGKVHIQLTCKPVHSEQQSETQTELASRQGDLPNTTWIHIQVSDTGIGLSEEEQQKLFAPFTQADGSHARKYGGTGLGLSISKCLVEMMNGKIGMTSKKNEGSVFWFEIPLVKSSSKPGSFEKTPHSSSSKAESNKNEIHNEPHQQVHNEAHSEVPNSEAHSSETHSNDLTSHQPLCDQGLILVVEDNPVNQLVAVTLLKKLGYTSHVANEGKAAIDAAQRTTYDLILMDCQMPEMDGYQATREIRKLEELTGKHIPIVALTANAMKEDEERCLTCGMDDYLSKPLKREMLSETLLKWIPKK